MMVGLPANAGADESAMTPPAANETASADFMTVLNMVWVPPKLFVVPMDSVPTDSVPMDSQQRAGRPKAITGGSRSPLPQ